MSSLENVYRVTLSDQGPAKGKSYLAGLTDALNEDKLVRGDRLIVERGDEDGVCLVRGYRGTALAKAGVGVIEESPLVFRAVLRLGGPGRSPAQCAR